MKRLIERFAAVVVALSALSGCAKDNDPHGTGSNGDEFTIRLLQTKTALDGNALKWVEGDKVNLFHAEHDTENFISDGPFEYTGDNTFKGFIREGSVVDGLKYVLRVTWTSLK